MGGRYRAARLSLGALAALALPAAALAATLNVNSTSDAYIAGDGLCTLSEAVYNANEDSDWTAGDCAVGSGADLINVPAGTYLANLYIYRDLTLRGAGASLTVVDGVGGTAVIVDGPGSVATLEWLTLTGKGGWGGVASLYGATLTLSECIVSGSSGSTPFHAVPTGGVVAFGFGATLTIRRSAVINNLGPGIVVVGGTARIENSTISGNEAAVHFLPEILGGPVVLLNSTVADNHCSDPCPSPPPAIQGSVTSQGVVISNPEIGNCGGDPLVSTGHNLDSDGSCGFTDPSDLSNVDPLLGPLQRNGGPTPTHALQRGSPAIDAIPSAVCTYDHDGDPGTPEVKLAKDQRGGMRPREGDGGAPSGCDIGAYEVAACADGLDNDGDGRIDFDGGATAGLTPLASPDPTCTSALGAAEAPPPPRSACGIGPELVLLVPALLALRRLRREN